MNNTCTKHLRWSKKLITPLSFLFFFFFNYQLSFAQTEQDAPTNLVTSNITDTGFKLTWDALTDASGVNVFIKDITNGSGSVYITTLTGDATSFDYSGTYGAITITNGVQYEAQIQALPDADGNAYAATNVIVGTVEQEAPTNLAISNVTNTGFKLTWDALTDASGVNVFIKDVTNGGSDFYITTLTGDATSFEYSGTYGAITITEGVEYETKIQALPDADQNAYAGINVTAGVIVEQDAPTNLAISNITTTSFKLTWDALTDASGVNVFIADPAASSGDVYITTLAGDATSFDFSGTYGSITITEGTEYTAKVQALPDADNNAFAEFTVTTSVTALEKNLPIGLDIFPNPIEDVIYIKNSSKYAIDELILLSITGKVIQTFSAMEILHVPVLPAGLYFLMVKEQGRIIGVQKVLKK